MSEIGLALAVAIARRLPRGGYPLLRYLAESRPELQHYPGGLRLVPDTVVHGDLRHSVWFPLFKEGCYPHQLAEDQLALSFLRKGDVVWDVGANIGYTSLIFAHAVGQTGKVIAIEPSRISYPMLQSTIAHDPRITAIHAAVSDIEGTIYFADSEMLDCSATVADPTKGYAVPCTTLDALHAQTGRVPDFIKVDVEGHEAQVFLGGKSLFAKHLPVLLFEALDATPSGSVFTLLGALSGGRYVKKRITSSGTLVPHDAIRADLTSNFIALTPEHAGRFKSLSL